MPVFTYTQYQYDEKGRPWIGADMNSDLDYSRDWTLWLNGDTIATLTPVYAPGLIAGVNGSSHNSTATIIWAKADIGHASAKVGAKLPLTHRIVTVAGRKEDFTVWLKLEEH